MNLGRQHQLYYVHDPMCSWCWAFRPTRLEIESQLPEDLTYTHVLGGLAPDAYDEMPADMQAYLQDIWRRIEKTVPGTSFNYDFWTQNTPKRSTYPACRAVIASTRQGATNAERMTTTIQRGYYQLARNPSEIDTLADFAEDIGCDRVQFLTDLHSESVQEEFMSHMNLTRKLGVQGFPSFALVNSSGRVTPLRADYRSPDKFLDELSLLLAESVAV